MSPSSITGKSLKMRNKSKSHFDLFCSDHSWMNCSELPQVYNLRRLEKKYTAYLTRISHQAAWNTDKYWLFGEK
jgi:hypothetical protein